MSACHEPIKEDTKELILKFIDNCKESFKVLETLIKLNEEGLNKCFEWIENVEIHVSKVHDLVNLEDRITACDVLNRLTLLENQCKNGYEYQKGGMDGLQERIKSLEFHKNLQIDENRKVSKHLGDIGGYVDRFEDDIHDLQVFKSAKLNTPHKCPICDGLGGTKISGTIDEECNSCNGKGIIWG